jgi:REP element-mobilizing transposase RayT
MNRGHRGGALFRDDTDRRRFLGLVAELPERFRVEVHAFVLMDTHYHLLLRTPDPNLGHAIRWLNVSYGVKYNWAHRLRGAVFQGRFKSVVIQDLAGVAEVARYIHLNPVRIGGLGLGKEEQRRARLTGCEDPGKALVLRRLEVLQEFPWSSWRVYSGAEGDPEWLETSWIGRGCGGRSRTEQRAALCAYTEEPIRQGGVERPWDRLVGGLVLGEAGFARQIMEGQRVVQEEQTAARRMRPRVLWGDVVRKCEALRGRPWGEWAGSYGDWSRDAAVHVAVRYGGMRLAEVVKELPGIRYQALAQGARRFVAQLEVDPERRKFVEDLRRELSII